MNREWQRAVVHTELAGIKAAVLAFSVAGCGGAAEGTQPAHDSGATTTQATDAGATTTPTMNGVAFQDAESDTSTAAAVVAIDAATDVGIGSAVTDFTANGNLAADATGVGAPAVGSDGYVTVDAGSVALQGYVASYTAGSPSTITLTYGSAAFCASGSVAPNGAFQSWAGAGFNVNQTESPAGGMTSALAISGSSMTLGFENFGGSTLRVQLADSGNNLWCYTLAQSTGPVTIPLSSFNSKCWDNSGQSFQPGDSITTFQLIVPGSDELVTPYNFCFLGVTIQ